MKTFTAWQYMLIDLANNFGLDKKLFEERIEWAEANLHQLDELVELAPEKTRALFVKAKLAIKKAQAGLPTGHTVALDACCSGIQVMSALTGCRDGANNTGLVDPDRRADAYGTLTTTMAQALAGAFDVSRDDAKDALMTMYYGSKKKPKEIFGVDTPQLRAFYQAAEVIAPGAYRLLQALLDSWRPYALFHAWKLPDGFDARVKVIEKKEARITVDELGSASFTYEFYVNEGTKTGLSNVANVIHSVDAYILRTIQRRCSYDREVIQRLEVLLMGELKARELHGFEPEPMNNATEANAKLMYHVEQYVRSTVADIVIAPYISAGNVEQLTTEHMTKLLAIINTMLVHKPFHVITVHDEFKCHPNYMNHLRQHYINIFAEIADSELLSDLLSQLYGVPGKADKLSTNLGDLIRQSNYALS